VNETAQSSFVRIKIKDFVEFILGIFIVHDLKQCFKLVDGSFIFRFPNFLQEFCQDSTSDVFGESLALEVQFRFLD
jgi:hypothetical protein